MNELSTTDYETVGAKTLKAHKTEGLLEKAAKLNKLSEVSQVALGMCLSIIKDQKAYEPEFSSFDQYYKTELKRSKGDVSKLLKVGDFMIRGKFPQETEVAYTVLFTAINALPDKDPQYVLATAQTNTIAEILENRRDDAFGTDHKHTFDPQELYKRCDVCGKFERV